MEVHIDRQGIFNNILNYSWFPGLKKGELIVIVVLLQHSIIINVKYVSTKMKEKIYGYTNLQIISMLLLLDLSEVIWILVITSPPPQSCWSFTAITVSMSQKGKGRSTKETNFKRVFSFSQFHISQDGHFGTLDFFTVLWSNCSIAKQSSHRIKKYPNLFTAH